MCGIAGVLGADAERGRTLTAGMLTAMVHRGPDQDGFWQSGSAPGVSLGHRRLSILDLSEAGRQPMIDGPSGAVIVFNGECYNFLELKSELEQAGRRFVSTSDTEVVLAAFLEWGEAALARLRGMFAIAIWDPQSETVLLARDRLGIKPLYYARSNGCLLFASEVRALLASGAVDRQLDPAAIRSYLWHGFVSGPRSIVAGVHSLPAGTSLRIDRKGNEVSRSRFWTLPRASVDGAARSSIADVRSELETAVDQHLRSDVPLGVFLSGGVDSSVVAAMAARASSKPVVTFNLRFDERRYDESGFARAVAGQLGTEHREVTLSESAFDRQLDDALESIDQPTFDAINTYFVSRAVREAGLTVALAGTGGDELFGGYASFVDIPRSRPIARLSRVLPRRVADACAKLVTRMTMGRPDEVYPQTRWGKLADVLATRGDLLALYQVSYGLFSRRFLEDLALQPVDDGYFGLDPDEARDLAALIRGEPELHAISLLELSSFLRERLLRDTDAASMAVSLEVRVPLLDHVFVEEVAALPAEQRFHPLRRKALLRELISDRIDPGTFDRPKAGFELPFDLWCRQRLAGRLAATFEDINLAHRCGLDAESVGRLWRAFQRGSPGIYWSRVWSLFVFMTWCRRHAAYA